MGGLPATRVSRGKIGCFFLILKHHGLDVDRSQVLSGKKPILQVFATAKVDRVRSPPAKVKPKTLHWCSSPVSGRIAEGSGRAWRSWRSRWRRWRLRSAPNPTGAHNGRPTFDSPESSRDIEFHVCFVCLFNADFFHITGKSRYGCFNLPTVGVS